MVGYNYCVIERKEKPMDYMAGIASIITAIAALITAIAKLIEARRKDDEK